MPQEDIILARIKKLREIYTFPQDQDSLFAWESSVKDAILKKDLKDMDGIKELIKELQEIIKDISFLICFDRTLTEQKRLALFEKREAFQWVISFFIEPAKVLKNIEDKLNKELQ